MARTPLHETMASERARGDRIPYGAPAVSRVRQTLLGMAANLTPAELAAAEGANPTQVTAALRDLEAAGFVLERDDGGRVHVANLEHEPQPIPRKAPLLRKAKAPRPRESLPASTDGRTPALGELVTVTGLYLEHGGDGLYVEVSGVDASWRVRVVR